MKVKCSGGYFDGQKMVFLPVTEKDVPDDFFENLIQMHQSPPEIMVVSKDFYDAFAAEISK